MPKSGKESNRKGTSGKHLGVEETAAFLLTLYFVGVMAGRRARHKNGRTWLLVGVRSEEGQTEIS